MERIQEFLIGRGFHFFNRLQQTVLGINQVRLLFHYKVIPLLHFRKRFNRGRIHFSQVFEALFHPVSFFLQFLNGHFTAAGFAKDIFQIDPELHI